MRKAFQIGAGFIGVIVGAGLASGQEILQFFTSFGALGIAGSVVATVLFAFLGMNLVQLGSRFQTTSHQNVIYYICGRYLGVVVDIIIIFFLFGVTFLTIVTVTLSVKKVITLISAITPFLLLLVIAMIVHSLLNYDISSEALQAVDVA